MRLPQPFGVLSFINSFRNYNLELSAWAWQSHSHFLLKPGYLYVECKLFGQTYRLLFLTQRDENGHGGQ